MAATCTTPEQSNHSQGIRCASWHLPDERLGWNNEEYSSLPVGTLGGNFHTHVGGDHSLSGRSWRTHDRGLVLINDVQHAALPVIKLEHSVVRAQRWQQIVHLFELELDQIKRLAQVSDSLELLLELVDQGGLGGERLGSPFEWWDFNTILKTNLFVDLLLLVSLVLLITLLVFLVALLVLLVTLVRGVALRLLELFLRLQIFNSLEWRVHAASSQSTFKNSASFSMAQRISKVEGRSLFLWQKARIIRCFLSFPTGVDISAYSST